MNRCIGILLGCLLATPALAALAAVADGSAAPTPMDYAYGAELRVPPGAALARIELPEAVYTGSVWPDLRDLRVFDAQGGALPYSLPGSHAAPSDVQRVSLTSYRVVGQDADGTPRVVLGSSAGQLQLLIEPGAGRPVEPSYLLAPPEPDLRLATLHLHWTQPQANFSGTATLEVSDDLRSWQPAARPQPLLDLSSGEQRLLQADLQVQRSDHAWRYWRLRLPADAPPLLAVDATRALDRPPPPSLELALSARIDEQGRAIYSLASPQPATALAISPADANSLLPLTVEARANSEASWQRLPTAVAYRLAGGNGESRNAPLQLEPAVVIGELRLTAIGTGFGSAPPQVRLLRPRQTLVFNARGEAPWLLAWGSRAAQSAALPLGMLMTGQLSPDLATLPEATPGETRTLGGSDRLHQASAEEQAKRQHLLLMWAALLLGTLALLVLAWRVWRETRDGSRAP